jgi:hypothetical protein
MNIIYFLFVMNQLHIKHTYLYKNNANLDFEDHNTTIRFNYYKRLLEERKERELRNKNYW